MSIVFFIFYIFFDGGLMPDFADRLKELRKSKGLTQASTAKSIGWVVQYYQKVEYGQFNPSYDKIVQLADFFDVSVDYLVGRSDNPNRQ